MDCIEPKLDAQFLSANAKTHSVCRRSGGNQTRVASTLVVDSVRLAEQLLPTPLTGSRAKPERPSVHNFQPARVHRQGTYAPVALDFLSY